MGGGECKRINWIDQLRGKRISRVAILRASRIGDFICITPALRAIRAALPDSEITYIGLPLVHEIAARSSHIDRFAEFPGFPGIAEQFFDARRLWCFFSAMQSQRFDLALQMHGSGVYSNIAALLLGADITIGAIRLGDDRGRLDDAFVLPVEGREVEKWLAFTGFLGVPPQGPEVEFPLTARDRLAADRLLEDRSGLRIGLHAGSFDSDKKYSLEVFASIATALLRMTEARIVLLGSAAEREECSRLEIALGGNTINLCGRTSLPVLGAVIERLELLIGNDSGPTHIASALGVPVVTLFRSTDPAVWGNPANSKQIAVGGLGMNNGAAIVKAAIAAGIKQLSAGKF